MNRPALLRTLLASPLMLLLPACLLSACLAPQTVFADEPTEEMTEEAERFFENQVRPIFAEHCAGCHGNEKQFGGLRVDSWQSLAEGSDSAPVVIAGDADNSLLIQAVRHENGLQMPPDETLSAAQVQTLVHWVTIGAPWPRSAPIPEELAAEQARHHWAFQPIVQPELPSVQQADWVQTPVDAFVLAALQRHELAPAPRADKATLIRRASYLVTGLPPTPERLQAFVESSDPKAYEKLIEELLASPHYGEQWARHWLDVARYSDSKGYVYAREERFWTHAWSYRDWVVEAFNQDRPYDDFLLMQLAADQAAASQDDLAAMGYLTLGRRFLGVKHDIIDDRIDVVCRGMMGLTVSCARCHDHKFDPIPTADYYSLYGVFDSSLEAEQSLSEASDLDNAYLAELHKRQQALADALAEVRLETADRVRSRVADYLAAQFELEKYPDETFGQLFQKSDLLPTIVRRWQSYLNQAEQRRDPVFAAWHRLAALADLPDAEFAPQAAAVCERLQSAGPESVNPRVAAAFAEPPTSLRQVPLIYGKLFDEVSEQAATASVAVGERAAEQLTAAAAASHGGQPHGADPAAAALLQVLHGTDSPCVLPDESIVELEMFLDIASCERLWRLQGEADRWIIQANTPDRRARILVDRPVPVQPRIFRRGNPLRKEAEVPRHFLSLLSAGPPQPFTQGSGRLELAQEIIDPQNPLTARVLVNRVWGQYFGRPLVETPSDFGLRASPPSHPELLDWLAARFIAEGWSLKKLHRWILLSATFQQSDQGPQDPRLRAHAMQIDPGNRWLWRWHQRRLTLEEMRDSLVAVSGGLDLTVGGKPVDLWQPPFSKRRTLYGLVDRQFLPGLLRVFDFANPDLHTAQRAETTAPQQALFFLNHPLVLEQARALAAAVADIEPPAERVSELFRTVLLRRPSPAELSDALALVASADAAPPQTPVNATRRDWSYGYGALDEDQRHTTGFTPLPYFDGQAWQGGPQFPDPTLGWVQLTAQGGHPGNDRAHAAIRRWTAPQDLEIRIKSTLQHEPEPGDGIRAFVLGSPASPGILAQGHAHQQTLELNAGPLRVAAGETIDFLVDIGDGLAYDQYLWHVTLTGVPVAGADAEPKAEIVWDSAADFSSREPQRLNDWEQLAQILLCTNEFLFVQ